MPKRNCLGMIWSVSRLLIGSGAAIPEMVTRLAMVHLLAYVDDAARQRCRSSHGRTHQVRAGTPSLPALEVAIGRGCAARPGLQDIVVHREAHRAPRLTPFEAGIDQDARNAFALRLLTHEP